MKLTDIGVIFVAVFICFNVVTDIRMNMTSKVSNEQIKYNNAIDTAVNDGMFMLVESDDGRKISMDTDKAVDVFLKSLAVNMGLDLTQYNKERFMEYIPVIAFALDDGVVIYHHDVVDDNGNKKDKFVKEALIPYRRVQDDLLAEYCLGDNLTIYSVNDYITGKRDELKEIYNIPFLNDEDFESKKSQTIVDTITDNLKKYSSTDYFTNKVDDYSYFIPYENDGIWSRTVHDISMFVMFSGYPYSDDSLGYYSKFAFGGARLWKKE